MSDDMKINTISRFSKSSPNLILEIHAHCEVPAGCGGVVLRWRNPALGTQALFKAVIPGKAEFWLNGVALDNSRLLLGHGRNILAIHVAEVAGPSAGLMIHLEFDPEKTFQGVAGGPITEFPGPIFSNPDGTWKYSTVRPGDGWKGLLFGDDDWKSLVDKPIPSDEENSSRKYQFELLRNEGACFVGPTDPVREFWARKSIDIPGPDSKP